MNVENPAFAGRLPVPVFQWIDYVKTAKALRQLFRKRSG